MGLLLLTVCLLGYFCFFKVKLRVPYSTAIPLSTSIIGVVLFISTLSGFLAPITYVIYSLGVLLFATTVYKEYQWHRSLKSLFPREVILLLSLITLYYIRVHSSYYTSWDDFSHLGVYTKELYLYDGLLHEPGDATSIYPTHFSYTRVLPIFNFFITKAIGYSEGHNIFATGLFSILLSSAVLVQGRVLQSLLLLFAVLASTALYTPLLRSLYMDGPIGIAFGASISLYIQAKDKRAALIYLWPILFLLPNIKEVGFWFAYAAAISIAAYFIFMNRAFNRNILFVLPLFILPYIGHKLWALYLLDFGIISPHSKFSFSKYIAILSDFSSEQKRAVLLMFWKSLFLFLLKEGSLIIYAMLGLLFYIQRKCKVSLREFLPLNIALLLTFAMYLSLRLFFYMQFGAVNFTAEEASRCASYWRYYGSFAVVFVFILASYIKLVLERANFRDVAACFYPVVVLVIIFCSIVCFALYKRPKLQFSDDRRGSALIAQRLSDLEESGKKVMTIYNNATYLQCVQITYELAPYNPYSELSACVGQTAPHWPSPYKLDKTFSIDHNMFNDQDSPGSDPTKYDLLHFASITDQDRKIISEAFHLQDVTSNIFVKKEGRFIEYSNAK